MEIIERALFILRSSVPPMVQDEVNILTQYALILRDAERFSDSMKVLEELMNFKSNSDLDVKKIYIKVLYIAGNKPEAIKQ